MTNFKTFLFDIASIIVQAATENTIYFVTALSSVIRKMDPGFNQSLQIAIGNITDYLSRATAPADTTSVRNDNLSAVVTLLTTIHELLQNSPVSPDLELTIYDGIFRLNDIDPPTVSTAAAYEVMGRVLIEARGDMGNGAICFEKAFGLCVKYLHD
jgi:hypothetical protein